MLPNSEGCRRWAPFVGVAIAASCLVGLAHVASPPPDPIVRVAMIGNSIQYFNDLPRVLEAMGNGNIVQNSCLHGNGNFESHLAFGNGMYAKWQTGQARLWDEYNELYDYGACTPQQLLLGTDERLEDVYQRRRRRRMRKLEEGEEGDEQEENEEENAYGNNDDGYEYKLEDDGTNPCLQDENYYWYLQNQYQEKGSPKWDYVVMNDNSRNPCCTEQRETSLKLFETVYLPWIKASNATPIFLVTYPYWASERDMSGLTDVPTFASLTYEGYREYAEVAARVLPSSQQPRLAPVGLAFLMIWEENPTLWDTLMHFDEIHPSPSGTFLEACVIYATIFGHLPKPDVVFDGEEGVYGLWKRARRMVPTEHELKPFPTESLAHYLYHVAHRVVVLGETPKSLTRYYQNESAYFTPDDSLYSSQNEV
jgi:hypothetical protein